jgi:hypothetical protein
MTIRTHAVPEVVPGNVMSIYLLLYLEYNAYKVYLHQGILGTRPPFLQPANRAPSPRLIVHTAVSELIMQLEEDLFESHEEKF